MTPTPSHLRQAILEALGKLSHFQANVAVTSSEVTALVQQGQTFDDPQKMRNNINFCATQVLCREGLVARTGRGLWHITEMGLATLSSHKPEDQQVCPTPTLNPPAPPTVVQASLWDADTSGINPYGLDVVDTITDPYIRGLIIENTSCFGGFRQGEPACIRCGVAKTCRAKQFTELSQVQDSVNPTPLAGVPAPTHPSPYDDLKKILEDIDVACAKDEVACAKEIAEVEMVARVDTPCRVCGLRIVENELAMYGLRAGFRHTKCQPLTTPPTQ